MVSPFSDEIAQEFAERKTLMSDVQDAFDLWKVAAQNAWMDKVAVAEDFCLEALKHCWGESCKINFNYDKLSITCQDANGAILEFK